MAFITCMFVVDKSVVDGSKYCTSQSGPPSMLYCYSNGQVVVKPTVFEGNALKACVVIYFLLSSVPSVWQL